MHFVSKSWEILAHGLIFGANDCAVPVLLTCMLLAFANKFVIIGRCSRHADCIKVAALLGRDLLLDSRTALLRLWRDCYDFWPTLLGSNIACIVVFFLFLRWLLLTLWSCVFLLTILLLVWSVCVIFGPWRLITVVVNDGALVRPCRQLVSLISGIALLSENFCFHEIEDFSLSVDHLFQLIIVLSRAAFKISDLSIITVFI